MSEHRRRSPQGGEPSGAPRPPRAGRADMRRAAQARGRSSGRGGGARPQGGTAGRKRLIDYPRSRYTGFRRWVPSFKQILAFFLLGFGSLVGAVGYAYAVVTIPSPNPSTTMQNNVFYWSDKSVMASVGSVDRQNISLDQVPKTVQWDFLAAENSSFYTDPGIDPQGILRAVYHMAQGGEVQSGSTITQQFVKNAFLDQSQTLTRKFKEIMISLKIGSVYSKQQILQGYLNTCYYGRGANGIEAAAEAYYHVHASQLNVSQGAFLTATVNQPSLLMYADTDQQAKATAEARWKYVLDRMVAIGKLSASEEASWLQKGFPTPLPMKAGGQISGQVGYLVQTAEDYIKQHSSITDQQLSKGGYQIYTTFDKSKVDALSASVAAMSKAHLNPKVRPVDAHVQVGAASVDPTTGAIVALYGGDGWDKGHYNNNANTVGVPVGSTFKPFVLASAIDNGAVLSPGGPRSPITPDSKFDGDNGITIKDQNGNLIQDANDPTHLLHQQNDVPTKWGYITLRQAMEQSINTPYVQLGEYVGYSPVENEAIGAGLLRSSLQYNTAGFFIGTSTPSAIRMAAGYGTFADNGVEHDPYSVTQVLYDGTKQDGFDPPAGKQAMPYNTAAAVTNVLQDVVKYGTGANAQALGRPVAGKTGTTDDYKSAWFIGYTPQLVTSVTMFKEDPNNPALLSMAGVGGFPKVFGADMPTQVWLGYMQKALAGKPVKDFPPMPNLGQGANENGAPTPAPSTSASAPPPSASAPAPSAPAPSASSTPCSSLLGGCTSPTPPPSPGGTATVPPPGGGGGLFGGGTGTPSPTSTRRFGTGGTTGG